MPIQTRILDNGNFVRSPESPAKAGILRISGFRRPAACPSGTSVQEDWNRSPFSAELGSRERRAGQGRERLRRDVQGPLHDQGRRAGPDLPAGLAVLRPVPPDPPAVLHSPLRPGDAASHGPCLPRTMASWPNVNAALNEDTPLRWWQSGPHGRPCYLFGSRVWELRPSEIALSEEGQVLLFLDLSESHRQAQGRLALRVAIHREPGRGLHPGEGHDAWSGAGQAASARSAGGTTGSISRASPRPAFAAKAPPTTSSCSAAAAVRQERCELGLHPRNSCPRAG